MSEPPTSKASASRAGPGRTTSIAAEQISAALSEAVARGEVDRACVGICDGEDELVVSAGADDTLVDDRSLFPVGAITKTHTALALFTAARREGFDLDADLEETLGLPTPGVTATALLSHTAGFAQWRPDFGQGNDALTRTAASLATAHRFSFPVPTYSYSHGAFAVTGWVLERILGVPYEEALGELVLQPLGMEDSLFGSELSTESSARQADWFVPRALCPALGLLSTVRDQLRFARFHLDSDVLSDLAKARCVADGAFEIGLSWFSRDESGTRVVQHGGAGRSFGSLIVLVPARRFAIVVLASGEGANHLKLHLTDNVLRHSVGLPAPSPRRRWPRPDDLREYTGVYNNGLAAVRVSTAGEGVLLVPASEPHAAVRADFVAKDRLIDLDGPLAGLAEFGNEFLRDGNGAVRWLRMESEVFERV